MEGILIKIQDGKYRLQVVFTWVLLARRDTERISHHLGLHKLPVQGMWTKAAAEAPGGAPTAKKSVRDYCRKPSEFFSDLFSPSPCNGDPKVVCLKITLRAH